MNPQNSFRRKIGYLVGIAFLLALLSWLGRPATIGTPQAEGSPGGKLAQMREQYEFSQAQLGDIDPTSETVKLATLGMRGVAANILWEKANHYKMKKDWTNLSATLEQITKVQPNFVSVWRFQGWNLAYNVSVEFDDFRERYRWVIRGIDYLKKGIEYNRREAQLHWDVGWFIGHKIGTADERKQFRRLFVEDNDFHGSRPKGQRDNWLVGKEWFLKAIELVDTLGVRVRNMDPLIYRSHPPMCQRNYAEALEKDGTFGEVAQQAWIRASRDWTEYGNFGFTYREPTTGNLLTIQLNQLDRLDENIKKTAAQLDALAPGLRQKIREEKRASLTAEQREALDTPAAKRTPAQQLRANEAESEIAVPHVEIARRLSGPTKQKAVQLVQQIEKDQRMAMIIARQREIVNFDYWRLRCQIEQEQPTLEARRLVYQADQLLEEGIDLVKARSLYEEGLKAWRAVLDKYPGFASDETGGRDILEIIDNYRRVLDLSDKPFPKDFILQDILNRHGQSL